MKLALFNIFLLITTISHAGDKIDDQTVFISEEDKAMNSAILKARSTLDNFFEIAKEPSNGATDFKLKVMVFDENGVEHLWFSPFKKVEGGYAGVLVNEPIIVTSLTFGKVYGFRESEITDWGYVQDGKQIGSFTICVLFKSMDVSTVNQYKKDHGFICNS